MWFATDIMSRLNVFRLVKSSSRQISIAAVVAVSMLGFAVLTQTAQASDDRPASGKRLLILHDAGKERGIMTSASTVRKALDEAKIPIDTHDITEPSLDEELVGSNYEVNIYHARPVVIDDGSVRTRVMTPYKTPKQIAKHAGVTLRDEDRADLSISTNILADGLSERMTIQRAVPFTFVFYGRTETAYTLEPTVGDMLRSKSIRMTEADGLSVPVSTPITPGMTVKLWRNGIQTVTIDEDVDFQTEQIKDADRPAGFREVKTPGVKGKRTVTYEVNTQNGEEVGRREINSTILTQPTKQVEIIGAKFNYTGGPLSEAQITALGMCESGMTATRNSGNGFYGAFQFMPSTWRSVAPAPYNSVLPHEAPLDAQKQAVQSLLSRSSIYTQFPGCAKKMTAQGIL